MNILFIITLTLITITNHGGIVKCLQHTKAFSTSIINLKFRIPTSRSKRCRNLLYAMGTWATYDQKTEVLRFGGEIFYSSNPLPYSDSLQRFFFNHNMQKILLSGGGATTSMEKDHDSVESHSSHRVTSIPFHSNLFETWKQKSLAVGARLPQENDTIVLVQPKGIDMVGIKILPQTIIGTTVSIHLHTTASCSPPKQYLMPEFQAVLIQDDTNAEGPPFLIWLFNKITRNDELNNITAEGGNNAIHGKLARAQNHGNNNSKTNHEAFLRVWVEPLLDLHSNTPNEIVFKSSVSMWLELHFPSFLLRFFPIHKSKAEELCSAAIIKSLQTSFSPAFQAFCHSYNESLIHSLAE